MAASELLLITGPTAAGKSGVGLWLAERLGAEIVSVDSMKVYRGMDIGTAKPTREARARVPHHMIDVADPTEEYNVARYVSETNAAIADIWRRGRRPLLVGGTPLYIRALLSGLFTGPGADPQLRARLWERVRREGPAVLHEELQRVDPETAARLHPNDARRIVRALEVFVASGRPISALQQQFKGEYRQPCRILALRRTPADLRARIERRVEAMFARGWVEEVRGLLAHGGLGPTAGQAAGYREIVLHLQGALSLPETISRVKQTTWRIARKQMAWLRHLPGVEWCEAAPDDAAETIGQRLYNTWLACHN